MSKFDVVGLGRDWTRYPPQILFNMDYLMICENNLVSKSCVESMPKNVKQVAFHLVLVERYLFLRYLSI